MNHTSQTELLYHAALKLHSGICGSLSKHRVLRVSIGCPTECCHGSQRLALKMFEGGQRLEAFA